MFLSFGLLKLNQSYRNRTGRTVHANADYSARVFARHRGNRLQRPTAGGHAGETLVRLDCRSIPSSEVAVSIVSGAFYLFIK